VRRFISLLALALSATLCFAGPASAAFGLTEFNVTFSEEDGSRAAQAGSHPFQMTTSVAFNTLGPEGFNGPDEQVDDLVAEEIAGLVGNPAATPRCTTEQFLSPITGERNLSCPNSTVVGAIANDVVPGPFYSPVYNLMPPPGVAAELGFSVFTGMPVTIEIDVKQSAPYNITVVTSHLPQPLAFFGSVLRLWGDPESPAHDRFRGSCLEQTTELTAYPELPSRGSCPASSPEKPFLILPRACAGPLATSYNINSWQSPAVTLSGVSAPSLMTGCSRLGFSPTTTVSPTISSAETPSGLSFSIDMKNEGLTAPDGIAQSDIKKVVATLPPGMVINPSAANGLDSCGPDEFAAQRLGEPGSGCPAQAKIGSVEVETPLLEREPLSGSIYLARQGDNPFGSLFALYLVLENEERGVMVKQAGKVEADPATGQLRTTFAELPQLPFSRVDLRFDGGPRAPLQTPATCGTYIPMVELTSWAGGPPVQAPSAFTVDSGAGGGTCPSALDGLPATTHLQAGTLTAVAGAYSPLVVKVSRPDGTQQLGQFTTTFPKGLLASLRGIPYCTDLQLAAAAARTGGGQGAAELASPSCPSASEVGTATVAVGSGPNSYYVKGHVYLAGPYKGAPFSLETVTPAIAGPVDLGVVAVRTALYVDPTSLQITAVSDPMPSMLHGVPLNIRSVVVDVNRQNFTLNPTSCAEKSFLAQTTSAVGVITALSERFQVGACEALDFKPTVRLRVKGWGKRRGHLALTTMVNYPKGGSYANISRAVLTLPRDEFVYIAHSRDPCTRVEFNDNACPEDSILGRARVFSSLLQRPLEGPVYLRSNGREHLPPDIVVDLNGQVHVILVGAIDSVRGSHASSLIQVTFAAVPDAPVSKFILKLAGDRRGLPVDSEDFCSVSQRASVRLAAQDGSRDDFSTRIRTSCPKRPS
jgi:hypothetical protein